MAASHLFSIHLDASFFALLDQKIQYLASRSWTWLALADETLRLIAAADVDSCCFADVDSLALCKYGLLQTLALVDSDSC
ncbi:hypothetical protein GN956_G7356 [Arapaima gigas]